MNPGETKFKDISFNAACRDADKLVHKGATVYQKWTCDSCGERVTANNPNSFTTLGLHEDCGHVTDIKAKGCGYMLIWGSI